MTCPRCRGTGIRATTKRGAVLWCRCKINLHVVAGTGPLAICPPGRASVDWIPIFDMTEGREVTLHEVDGPMARSCRMLADQIEQGDLGNDSFGRRWR